LRRALIDTALQIIDEEGIAAVTIRTLAQRLGVSHAAPGYHFADRDALLVEVATEGFRLFADTLEAAARGTPTPTARMVAVGLAYVRFASQHPSYLRVMFGRGVREGYEWPEPLQQEAHRGYRALTLAVESLVATVPGNPGSVEEISFASWSLVHGMAMLWIDGPARHALGDEAALLAVAERAILRQCEGIARQGGAPGPEPSAPEPSPPSPPVARPCASAGPPSAARPATRGTSRRR
jgi:AcrR family transcriptional regulator